MGNAEAERGCLPSGPDAAAPAAKGFPLGWPPLVSRGPRLVPGMTPVPMRVREMPRLLEDDGWYLVTTVGGHRQYKHPTKAGRVTVPGKPGKD